MTVSKVIDKLNGNSRGRALAAPVSASTFEFAGKELLTPREREVLELVATGASNKEAGRHLGISPRTVETHRAHILEKVGARNTADLVRIVFSGGRAPLSADMVA